MFLIMLDYNLHSRYKANELFIIYLALVHVRMLLTLNLALA